MEKCTANCPKHLLRTVIPASEAYVRRSVICCELSCSPSLYLSSRVPHPPASLSCVHLVCLSRRADAGARPWQSSASTGVWRGGVRMRVVSFVSVGKSRGHPAVHLHSAGRCCMYYCASTCCTCWRCFSGTGTVARVTQAEFSGYKKTCYQSLSYFSTHFFTLLAKNTLHCTVLLL